MLTQYDWKLLLEARSIDLLASGLLVTVELTVACIVVSTILGVLVGVLRASKTRFLLVPRAIASLYVEFFRNVPLLVQLFFWTFGVFSYSAAKVIISPLTLIRDQQFVAGVIAISIYASTFIAEIVRSGLTSIPLGQVQAGHAHALKRSQILRHIELPQVVRIVMPAIGNEYFSTTKNTSLVMTIGVADLLYQAYRLESLTLKPIEVFTAVAVIYLVLCLFELWLLQIMNRRLGVRQ